MINLFNLGDGKTRYVIGYVEQIEIPLEYGLKELDSMKKIKKKALKPGLTANEMLDIIGYNPTGTDAILEVEG